MDFFVHYLILILTLLVSSLLSEAGALLALGSLVVAAVVSSLFVVSLLVTTVLGRVSGLVLLVVVALLALLVPAAALVALGSLRALGAVAGRVGRGAATLLAGATVAAGRDGQIVCGGAGAEAPVVRGRGGEVAGDELVHGAHGHHQLTAVRSLPTPHRGQISGQRDGHDGRQHGRQTPIDSHGSELI